MAYTSGVAGSAVGDLLAILDVDLVANACWSIHDAAAGVNAKVYKCEDAAANVLFYVYVNDNIGIVYANFEIWEDWDEVGHAGVGMSITAANGFDFLRRKDIGGYGMCVSDHRFIHIDFVRYAPTYIGQLVRFDTSKNMPIVICSGDNTGSLINPIGSYNTGAALWRCLFDENQVTREINPVGKASATGIFTKTIAGSYWVPEIAVYNGVTTLVMGTLEGVGSHLYLHRNGLANGDIITIDAVEWVALFGDGVGNYGCLIRKS